MGDIVDRGPDSFGCVEELMKIKNLIAIRGNHDYHWLKYLKTGDEGILWRQGAKETYESYVNAGVSPEVHYDFFNNQLEYAIDEDNNLFIHGGFNRHQLIEEETNPEVFYWDRDLFLAALSYQGMKDQTRPFRMKDGFRRVFIGHTPTQYFGSTVPMRAANIWNLDTGCGKGKDNPLTIMNIDTEEYWQFNK